MSNFTHNMKATAKTQIAAMESHAWTMWHNGSGQRMTRGFETFVTEQVTDDGFVVCLRARQNKETGRFSFNWSRGCENITQAQAEQMIADFNN